MRKEHLNILSLTLLFLFLLSCTSPKIYLNKKTVYERLNIYSIFLYNIKPAITDEEIIDLVNTEPFEKYIKVKNKIVAFILYSSDKDHNNIEFLSTVLVYPTRRIEVVRETIDLEWIFYGDTLPLRRPDRKVFEGYEWD